MSQKREDYITGDEYFMGVAILSGMRSKDPGTQVGACIVSQDNKSLSMGYNGFPKGCSDDEFPWGKEHEADDPYNAKYFYSTHSELNLSLIHIWIYLRNWNISDTMVKKFGRSNYGINIAGTL